MKLVQISSENEFQALQPAWNTLLERSAAKTTFLSWEWLAAWWPAYGTPGELRILAVSDESGVLRGVAPLRQRRVARYGQSAPVWSFIGDGSNDSDYLDFIAEAGWEERVMAAFLGYWRERAHEGAVLELNEIPAGSPNLALLRQVATEPGMLWTEGETLCGTVRLPPTWEAYLSGLRPRFRTKIRSVLRNLEERPEARFEMCRDWEEVERLLPALFELHTRRWQQDGKPGVFGWERKREFYSDVSRRLLDTGRLRFSRLEWNGKVLACQYGFTYGSTYFHLQEGYEPACEHWSIGLGLRAWSMRELQREGTTEYDFLGGVGRHKTDWGAEVKKSKRILTAGRSYRSLWFCRGPEWELQAREALAKVLPDKLLAARRKWLLRSAGRNGSGPETPTNRRSRIRRIAADCYLSLGLPRLTRPLRERYQLSVSAGRVPKVEWSRRTKGSGRILYYHRVNDENDPFFPAISCNLFEQEMGFLARYYRVVSLAELIERLDAGGPENLVAVTFDDGYADNFHHAFPILQRYGLPATIFLTTGSIDSREPMWFEKLAAAVKKTGKESIDLEIDIPRRFWLRTEAERLAAHGAIFGLLKRFSDAERRLWLARILGELGVEESSERHGKMLSWDQARTMKAQGIDFGGHTVSHPFLSKMTRQEVCWEISECKRRIEEELQAPVAHFAYPNGREEDFGAWNKELIRAAGYQAAATTIWGLNYASTDRMELRRGGPWEDSASTFAYKLDWYQLVND